MECIESAEKSHHCYSQHSHKSLLQISANLATLLEEYWYHETLLWSCSMRSCMGYTINERGDQKTPVTAMRDMCS